MHELENHIDNFLKRFSGRFIVACSGGLDSMVLLNILHRLKFTVAVAHVNYQLRSEDSEKDEQFIAAFCEKHNIPFYLNRFDLKTHLEQEGGNLQEQARNIRYAFFSELIQEDNTHILLAQHADDQVETFFLNVARNAGIMGLSCMLSENGNYLRPLLPFSKAQLKEYARDNAVQWREDASNARSYYTRNKLRNLILPELFIKIPSLKDSVLTLVNTFQNTQQSMKHRVREIVEFVKSTKMLTFSQYDAMNEFEFREFMRTLRIPQSYYCEFAKLRQAEKSKHIVLQNPEFLCVMHQGDCFEFVENTEHVQLPVLSIVTVDILPPSFNKNAIYLNPDKINGSLSIRRWKTGDRIKPIGVNGSKRISQVLKDAHIPIHLRKNQFVVEDVEKIVWCVGFSIGREAIADNQSKKVRVSVIEDNP